MMDVLLCYFISLHGIITAQILQLSGPTKAFRGQTVRLNCTSDTVPQGSSAEFMINNISFNNIRYFNRSCFKTVNVAECIPAICGCSSNGRSFEMTYNSNDIGLVSISCRMKFSSDSSSYFKTENLVLDIIDKPEAISHFVCNKSSGVVIPCDSSDERVTGRLVTHTVNGHFIRSFDLSASRKTFISFTTCTKEHMGLYECSVKPENKLDVSDAPVKNRKMLLYILGPPVFSSKHIDFLEDRITLSVTFYCTNKEHVLSRWYRRNIFLFNSTQHVQRSTTSMVNIDVFGKNISFEGFTSMLTLIEAEVPNLKDLHFCASNIYGQICEYFSGDKGFEFNLTAIKMVIVGIVSFVSVVSVILIIYKYLQTKIGHMPIPAEQCQNTDENISLYQDISTNLQQINVHQTGNAVYEGLSQNHQHIYSEPGRRYEELDLSEIDRHVYDSSHPYEKVD